MKKGEPQNTFVNVSADQKSVKIGVPSKKKKVSDSKEKNNAKSEKIETLNEEDLIPKDMVIKEGENPIIEVNPSDSGEEIKFPVTTIPKIGNKDYYFFCKIFTTLSNDLNEDILALACIAPDNSLFYAEIKDCNIKKFNYKTLDAAKNILIDSNGQNLISPGAVVIRESKRNVANAFFNWLNNHRKLNKIQFAFWDVFEIRYLFELVSIGYNDSLKLPVSSYDTKISLPAYISNVGFGIAQEVSTSIGVHKDDESGNVGEILPIEFVITMMYPEEIVQQISWYKNDIHPNNELINKVPLLKFVHMIKAIFEMLFIKGM